MYLCYLYLVWYVKSHNSNINKHIITYQSGNGCKQKYKYSSPVRGFKVLTGLDWSQTHITSNLVCTSVPIMQQQADPGGTLLARCRAAAWGRTVGCVPRRCLGPAPLPSFGTADLGPPSFGVPPSTWGWGHIGRLDEWGRRQGRWRDAVRGQRWRLERGRQKDGGGC
jgi:hypothetical protein